MMYGLNKEELLTMKSSGDQVAKLDVRPIDSQLLGREVLLNLGQP